MGHGARPVRLGKFVRETDIVVPDAFEHDVEAAGADHPLQAMVAIFALEHAALHRAGDLRHARDESAAACAAFCTEGRALARASHWPSGDFSSGQCRCPARRSDRARPKGRPSRTFRRRTIAPLPDARQPVIVPRACATARARAPGARAFRTLEPAEFAHAPADGSKIVSITSSMVRARRGPRILGRSGGWATCPRYIQG